jgi:hypothetical protein
MKTAIMALGLLLCASTAFAQESEFKAKLQEDMDYYVKSFASQCGATVKATWTGGKLGSNPRETPEGHYSAVSTLCTSGFEGASSACSNGPVKEKFAKLNEIQCTRGKGAMTYTLKGAVLSIAIDTAYDKNNPAGQRDDLTAKLKKDLDT